MRISRRLTAAVILGAALAALAPGSAIPAKRDATVAWADPTPPENAVIGVSAKTQVSVSLAANGTAPNVTVHIRVTGGALPGAVLHYTDGNPASATYVWTPKPSQLGDHHVTFTASTDLPVGSATRTVVIRVGAANQPPPGPPPPPGVYPKRFLLSDGAKATYRWTFVQHPTIARSGPSRSARAISAIPFRTPELYRNAILVLDGVTYRNGQTWVRIRLAVLPNGSTGWVQRGSLSGFQEIHTHLIIDRGSLRATLYRFGRNVFSTGVGVGQPRWPTPRGEFYVREKLSGYFAPAYGPRAFGLNARSAVLTDWMGGGFIGIHGTNEPQILPGRVSHGCVRMRNAAIMTLFRLMPLGTPVTIR